MRKLGSARSRPRLSPETIVGALVAALLAGAGFTVIAEGEPLRPYEVVGDAISESLAETSGDPARGRAIVLDRRFGACLLCHSGPFSEEKSQGTLAPDLSGSGSRWSAGQLRLRLVDAMRLNPDTIMPAYYRVDGFTRVGSGWRGRPILKAEQIEDVVAFLLILRD